MGFEIETTVNNSNAGEPGILSDAQAIFINQLGYAPDAFGIRQQVEQTLKTKTVNGS
jgi:hypothetical protein